MTFFVVDKGSQTCVGLKYLVSGLAEEMEKLLLPTDS